MAADDEAYAAFVAHQKDLIDRYGWSVISVFPTEKSPGKPFAYTVGLTPYGYPELMISGLSPRVAGGLLNDMAGRTFDRAERFANGQRISDLLVDLDVIVVDADGLDEMPPTSAYSRYGREKVSVQQIVWPDKAGLFPWEAWSLGDGVQPVFGRPAGAEIKKTAVQPSTEGAETK